MSLILNIESSSKNCSVSISKNGKIIALQEQSFEEYSHSKSLHVFIDKLFKEIELLPNDLSAVAISEGPVLTQVLELVYLQLREFVLL